MSEKNIFIYKLFLSLSTSDFNLFLCKNCTPHWKRSPDLSQQPPLKMEIVSSLSPLFENLVGGSTLPQQKGGGCTLFYQHYVLSTSSFFLKILLVWISSINFFNQSIIFNLFFNLSTTLLNLLISWNSFHFNYIYIINFWF